MASTLSARQTRFYQHRCTIYKPKAIIAGRDPSFDETPIDTEIPFYRETRPNFDNPAVFGRMDQVDIFVSDIGHFPISYDDAKPHLKIGAGYLIVFTTAGHPETGRALITLGVNQVKNLFEKTNKQMFYMKFVPLPRFLNP